MNAARTPVFLRIANANKAIGTRSGSMSVECMVTTEAFDAWSPTL